MSRSGEEIETGTEKKVEGTVERRERQIIDVAWEKIHNQYGSVETSTYRGAKIADKAVFYAMGLAGSVDKFKKKFVANLIKEGYDVVLIHRNGTDLTAPSPAIDSPERLALAKKNGETYLGEKSKYGYKEWAQEFAIAVKGLEHRYREIKFVGSSFGSLVGLEGLRQLQAHKDPVVDKIKTFVSLSGQVGLPEKDPDGTVWIDRSRKYSLKPNPQAKTSFEGILNYLRKNSKSGGGMAKIKDTETIEQEYMDIMHKIYEPQTNLPENTNYVLAMSWKEQFFATQQARALMKKIGEHALFIADRTQKGSPIERHGMPRLTSANLIKWLNLKPDKKDSRVYSLNDPAEDIKPVNWLGKNKKHI